MGFRLLRSGGALMQRGAMPLAVTRGAPLAPGHPRAGDPGGLFHHRLTAGFSGPAFHCRRLAPWGS